MRRERTRRTNLINSRRPDFARSDFSQSDSSPGGSPLGQIYAVAFAVRVSGSSISDVRSCSHSEYEAMTLFPDNYGNKRSAIGITNTDHKNNLLTTSH